MPQNVKQSALTVAIVTLSFRGDFELCRLLCETIDRCVAPAFQHIVAVPKSDLVLFAPLANARRQIIAETDLIPHWLYKVPLPHSKVRKLLRLPRRNIYVTRHADLVRGWIAQQIMKLRATSLSGTDVVVHVDSDVAFVRDLSLEHIVQDGKVRLLRTPGEGDTPMHAPWHQAAAGLLGLPPARYHGADFIGNLITWRRPLADAMMERISQVKGMDGLIALAKTSQFSEYILYGVFCERVIGLAQSGHFATHVSLCKTVWSSIAPGEVETTLAGLRLDPDQVAVGLQSTLGVDIAQRRTLVERLVRAA